MTIEVWSDIVCPFCYIGKRKFEAALEQFPDRENIEIVWKSFQLAPEMRTDPSISIHQWLARAKGFPLDQAKQMNAHVSQLAHNVGLTYHLDTAVVANTFRAHVFLHFAKSQGKQGEAKERLLKAYFSESKNVDDISTLIELGQEIGLDPDAVAAALADSKFANEVRADIAEAQQLGIHGVPFFVLDRKYGVSGAQEPATFLKALTQAFAEWRQSHPVLKLEVAQGPVCGPDGIC
jgi:predicted DsbA family dithiol-disulfide isomerase